MPTTFFEGPEEVRSMLYLDLPTRPILLVYMLYFCIATPMMVSVLVINTRFTVRVSAIPYFGKITSTLNT